MQALLSHRSRLLFAVFLLSFLSLAAFTSTPVKVRTTQSQASISTGVQSPSGAAVSDDRCPILMMTCPPMILPPFGLHVGPDGSAPADFDEFSM
jgi:hypothetical protein